MRLYSGYMFEEYGDCDSDYVFVNLFAQPYVHDAQHFACGGGRVSAHDWSCLPQAPERVSSARRSSTLRWT